MQENVAYCPNIRHKNALKKVPTVWLEPFLYVADAARHIPTLFQFLQNLLHLRFQFFNLLLLRVFLALQGGYYLLLLFDGFD